MNIVFKIYVRKIRHCFDGRVGRLGAVFKLRKPFELNHLNGTVYWFFWVFITTNSRAKLFRRLVEDWNKKFMNFLNRQSCALFFCFCLWAKATGVLFVEQKVSLLFDGSCWLWLLFKSTDTANHEMSEMRTTPVSLKAGSHNERSPFFAFIFECRRICIKKNYSTFLGCNNVAHNPGISHLNDGS